MALVLLVLTWFGGAALAAPVGPDKARKIINTWLAKDSRPLGSRLGNKVESIQTFTDDRGKPLYYVVYLKPGGFAIVPDEDLVEPLICFSSQGTFDPSESNPLGALVSNDLPGRVNAARAIQKKAGSGASAASLTSREIAIRKAGEKSLGKWKKLLAEDNAPGGLVASIGSVSDVRVSPLLQTKWGQSTACGNACFNYYTPPYVEGNEDNYVCGCVATAMAQYMRFWQYPAAGVGTPCFEIKIDDEPNTTECLRGGDGAGGAYHWSDMVTDPGCSTTEVQRQAIGALTYDAGVSVEMHYTADGSAAYVSYAADELVATFDYSNAIFGNNYPYNIGAGLNAMVNPNLDDGNPVILGIRGSGGGHAIVADGYGYQSSTLYHHLNMGWDGLDDTWYNLPDIDCSPPVYNVVDSAIYNIFTSGSGEIISGRVTLAGSGEPIAGATVTAVRDGGGTFQDTTNAKGIYAIGKVPSNSDYTISVSKTNYLFTTQDASTGQSQDWEETSGNCWGINFTGTPAGSVPVALDSSVDVAFETPETITLQAIDDGLPDPPAALTYTITSLPGHGALADPSAGDIDTVPYSLDSYGSDVVYTPVARYIGPDSFQFMAGDGDNDSNVATVSITVLSPAPEVIYETGFDTGLPDGWTIINGGDPADTWNSDNADNHTSPYWTDQFMIVDSNYAGYVSMDEQLITHSIDCTNWTGVTLNFKHDFWYYLTQTGDVDVRINGGVWKKVARYRRNDYSGVVELPLSSFWADGDPNVQIRWHYYKAFYDGWWGIDDVQITASPLVPSLVVNKCSVTAGSGDNADKISFSGTMNAGVGNILDADTVDVSVDSNDLGGPAVVTFPIDVNTFKKGKYKYSGTEGVIKKSFAYDTKTHKFSFSASNLDLSGLGCPATAMIEIADFNATDELDETLVNGTKPIPIKLMMGVKDTFRVDSCTVLHGLKPNTDQFMVKGGFAFENQRLNMAAKDLIVTLGPRTFTIPAGRLIPGKGKFSCSKAPVTEGGLADITFDFNLCSFTLAIKNISTITTNTPFDFSLAEPNSVLDDAVTYDGNFPELSSIDYPTKTGDTLTLTVAYAGFVRIDVNSSADVNTVLNAIEVNGGTVVSALPATGLYLVQVADGQEADFLTAMYDYSWVEDGSPDSPAVQGHVRVMDWDDPNGASYCSASHMTGVAAVAGRLGGNVSETDVQLEARDMTTSLPQAVLWRMEMDELSGKRTVYNLSLQSAASGTVPSNLDRTGCSEGYCRTIRHQQILFYRALLSGMEEMASKSPNVLNNALVTIIAGNAGIDLDNELAALKHRFPNAFKHVVIVGGTDASGNITTTLSHLSDNDDPNMNMVYARAKDVNVGTHLCSGTSFAAPEVSAVLDYIWKKNPFMTSDEVVEIFKQVVAELGSDNKVPQDANGRTTAAFLDRATELARAIPPPVFCSYAISPASASFGASGGSGSVKVTTSSDCPWSAVSNSSWIAVGSDGGNSSGTVPYTVSANVESLSRTGTMTIAGKTVTVTQAKRMPTKYVGSFSGWTTADWGACLFKHTVTGTGTITITGSTTGTFKVSGSDRITVLDGEGCKGGSASASYWGSLTIAVNGVDVSASVSNPDGTSADFTGTINGNNTITGTLTLDASVFDSPIVGDLILYRQ